MSDETFSITCSAEPPEGVDRGWFMFFITLLDQIYWVASAGHGAALGAVLPFSTEGVDFVMTAMFVVIFLNQWEKEKQHASAIIGIAAAGLPAHLRLRQLPHPLDGLHPCGTAAAPPPHRGQRKRGGKMSKIPVHPDHRRLRGGDHAHPFSALSGVRLPGRQGA